MYSSSIDRLFGILSRYQYDYTYDVDILPSTIDIKSELVYSPTPSFDLSSKIKNKFLVLLKYLRIFLQQSSALSLDTTDIFTVLTISVQVHYMAYIYAQNDSRLLSEIFMLNPFIIYSLYFICKNISIQLYLSL